MTVTRFASVSNAIRRGPLGGVWLFAWVFVAQVGHLAEHISVAIQGRALLGREFDSELSHLLFNSAIALLAVLLVTAYPRNPWAYPLLVISVLHAIEHVYIFHLYVQTGVASGPGLFGLGGAIGIIPLQRIDLHNVYNGVEVIFVGLGLWHEAEMALISEQLRA